MRLQYPVNHVGRFLRIKQTGFTGKTVILSVQNKDEEELGHISWCPPWRKYVLFVEGGCMWDDGCLNEVSGILKLLNEDHKGMT